MDHLKLERIGRGYYNFKHICGIGANQKMKFGQKKWEVQKVREESQVQKYKLGTDGEEQYQREWSEAGALIGSVDVKYLT